MVCSNGGMVDTKDLKSFGHCDRAGSSPASSTRSESAPERLNASVGADSFFVDLLAMAELCVTI